MQVKSTTKNSANVNENSLSDENMNNHIQKNNSWYIQNG